MTAYIGAFERSFSSATPYATKDFLADPLNFAWVVETASLWITAVDQIVKKMDEQLQVAAGVSCEPFLESCRVVNLTPVISLCDSIDGFFSLSTLVSKTWEVITPDVIERYSLKTDKEKAHAAMRSLFSGLHALGKSACFLQDKGVIVLASAYAPLKIVSLAASIFGEGLELYEIGDKLTKKSTPHKREDIDLFALKVVKCVSVIAIKTFVLLEVAFGIAASSTVLLFVSTAALLSVLSQHYTENEIKKLVNR